MTQGIFVGIIFAILLWLIILYLTWVDEILRSLITGTKLMEGSAETLNFGTADFYGACGRRTLQ